MSIKTIQLFIVICLSLNLSLSFARGRNDHQSNSHHKTSSHNNHNKNKHHKYEHDRHHKYDKHHHQHKKHHHKDRCDHNEFKSWDSLKNSSIVDYSEDDLSIVVETDCEIKFHKDFVFSTDKDLSVFAKELEIKKDSSLIAKRLLIVTDKEFKLDKKSDLCAEVVILESQKKEIKGDICASAVLLGSSFNQPSAQAMLEVSVNGENAPVEAVFDWSKSFGLFESAAIDFGDGTSQNLEDKSILKVYEVAGDYSAKLTLHTSNGEILSNNVEVIVNEANPIIDFGVYYIIRQAGTPMRVSVGPNYTQLVQAPEEIKEFRFNFGDGTTLTVPYSESPTGVVTHVYAEQGTYQVTVEAETVSGYVKTATRQIDFINDTNPVPLYSLSGFNGQAPLTVTFNGEAYDDSGEQITYNWFFADTGEQFFGTQYQQVTHTFTQEGIHYVYYEVRDEKRGRRITYIPIFVGDYPSYYKLPPVAIAESTARFGEGPLTVEFSASRSFDPNEVNTGLRYSWNFGDYQSGELNFATTANAVHTFNKPGSYFVNLEVISDVGLTHSEFLLVSVDGPEVNDIDFEVTPTGNLYEFAFNAQGYFEETDYIQESPRWSFGDGTYQVNEPYVTHKYQSAGTYDVKLKLRRPDGDYDSYTRRLVVGASESAAVAQIEKQSDWFNLNQPVQMQAVFSEGAASSKTIYRWSMGDGTIIKGQGDSFKSIVHSYNQEGDKNIRLTITDDNGLTSTSNSYIQQNRYTPEINGLPIYFAENPAPVTVAFQPYETSQDLDGNFSYYVYEFGDGSANVQTTNGYQEHRYEQAGTYTVAVSVFDTLGLSSRFERELVIKENQPPIISDFNYYYGGEVAPASIFVEAWPYISDQDGNVVAFEYVWGDGSSEVTDQSARDHLYVNGGNFELKVRVQDNSGNWSEYVSKNITININQAPILAYVPVYGQPDQPAPTSVAFAPYEGATDDQGIARYTYDFMDGSPLLDTTDGYVEHIFESAGTFNVVITAYDFYGLSDSLTVPLTIKANQPPVIADILIGGADQIKPEKLTFDVRSVATDSDGFIVNYEFSLNGFSTTQGQGGGYWEVPFFGGGEFQVQVTVTDNYGASASRSKSFFVDDNYAPVAVIDFDKDVITVGESIELRAGNSSDQDGTIVKYSWTLPDIGIVESETTVFSSATAGSYVIKLEVEDDKGKKATTQRSIRVNSPPEIIAECFLDELTGNTILCSAEGSSDEDGIATFKWSIADESTLGITATLSSPYFGRVSIDLEVTDTLSAVSYETIYVDIPNPGEPVASFEYGVDLGLVTTFDASASTHEGREVALYQWKIGDDEIVESIDPTLVKNILETGNIHVVLTVVDSIGRSNSIEKDVYIYNVTVPDPGAVGKETLAGIDSDSNGIRDDVQRSIASLAAGDIQIEQQLKKTAIKYQEIASGNLERSRSIELTRQGLDDFKCLISIAGNSDSSLEKLSKLKAATYNTKERFLNSLIAYEDASGEIFNVDFEVENYAQYCN